MSAIRAPTPQFNVSVYQHINSRAIATNLPAKNKMPYAVCLPPDYWLSTLFANNYYLFHVQHHRRENFKGCTLVESPNRYERSILTSEAIIVDNCTRTPLSMTYKGILFFPSFAVSSRNAAITVSSISANSSPSASPLEKQ